MNLLMVSDGKKNHYTTIKSLSGIRYQKKNRKNIRKHKDIKLVTNKESYQKHVMKPNFKCSVCFSEDLVGMEMGKVKVKMYKPVYLGQVILDLSKLVMYEVSL